MDIDHIQVGGGASSREPIRGDAKIILYWTKYFEWTDFGVGVGRKPFIDAGCNLTNCWTTTDRSMLNRSHAVLFHARDLDPYDLPPARWRSPHQRYIFFNYESPAHTDLARLKLLFSNYFNWTMTYRLDSDVVSQEPYGSVKCIRPSCSSEESTEVAVLPDLKGKNRTIAWFVSNCKTDSRRELLVRNLTRYIPVDIYGSCARRKCGMDNMEECYQMLEKRYRFYLSFENSLCTDYVTEKLYRALDHGVVPVVYGGADYSRFLPAGSYINAMDFSSPRNLADYLNQLMTDDEGYLEFFRWKAKYRVDPKPMDGWCRLCQLLHHIEQDHDEESSNLNHKSYDIATWWAGQPGNLSCSAPPISLVSPIDMKDDSAGPFSSINKLLDTLEQIVRNVIRR